MRLKCNECNEIRNISQDNYDKMLHNHAILRGFQLGLTTAIPSMFDKRFLLPDTEPLKHIRTSKLTKEQKETLKKLKKEASITKELSKEGIEKHFFEHYRCRICKTNTKRNFNIIKDLKENFKPWKHEESNLP